MSDNKLTDERLASIEARVERGIFDFFLAVDALELVKEVRKLRHMNDAFRAANIDLVYHREGELRAHQRRAEIAEEEVERLRAGIQGVVARYDNQELTDEYNCCGCSAPWALYHEALDRFDALRHRD